MHDHVICSILGSMSLKHYGKKANLETLQLSSPELLTSALLVVLCASLSANCFKIILRSEERVLYS